MLLVLYCTLYQSVSIFHSSIICHEIAIGLPSTEVYRGLLNGAAAAIKAVTDDVNIAEEVRLLKRQELNSKSLIGGYLIQK